MDEKIVIMLAEIRWKIEHARDTLDRADELLLKLAGAIEAASAELPLDPETGGGPGSEDSAGEEEIGADTLLYDDVLPDMPISTKRVLFDIRPDPLSADGD